FSFARFSFARLCFRHLGCSMTHPTPPEVPASSLPPEPPPSSPEGADEPDRGTPPLPPEPDSPEPLRGQVESLQGEVDRLLQEMEILRGWFQTLVSGLMIAIIISISIASWFAYRLLEQEQVTTEQSDQAETVREELLERVTQLEEDMTSLSQEAEESTAGLRGTVQTQQVDLEQLRDRINKLESRQSSLESQVTPPDEAE
ncbi:MAG: hypothetical protein ACO4AI_12355, partial [Prochlorothrix sp.]